MANRPLQDIDDDVLAACRCMGSLADHVADNGTSNAQVLINLERAAEGFHRLMIERRAVVAAG